MRSGDLSPSEFSPLLSSPRDHGANDEPAYSPDSPDLVVAPISRADLIWVLTGLWSAVFLGALDGKHNSIALRSSMNHF